MEAIFKYSCGEICSARRVSSIPKDASFSEISLIDFRLWRIILRRWLKAKEVKCSSFLSSLAFGLFSNGRNNKTLDHILGAGVKQFGFKSINFSILQFNCDRIDKRP